MGREYLEDLIARMAIVEECQDSRDSVSWKAHREAETLTDAALLPILETIILEHPRPKERRVRGNAYFVYGKVLKNTFQRAGYAFLLQRLTVETDKYVISSLMDRLADLEIPGNLDIAPVIAHARNEKWLIRHSAIRVLGACAVPESREALAWYLMQEDEKKYKHEITYANAAMGKVGTAEDIPLLERHLHSRRPDIRISAELAIQRIKARGAPEADGFENP